MIRYAEHALSLKAGSHQEEWLAIGLISVHSVKLSKAVVRFAIGLNLNLLDL